MLRTVTQYGVFTFLGAAIILLLSFVVEKGIKQVDDMLVPCQHGTYLSSTCLMPFSTKKLSKKIITVHKKVKTPY